MGLSQSRRVSLPNKGPFSMVPNHDQPVSQGSDGGGLVQLTSQDVRGLSGLSDHRITVDLVLELAISDLTWNQQTDYIYISDNTYIYIISIYIYIYILHNINIYTYYRYIVQACNQITLILNTPSSVQNSLLNHPLLNHCFWWCST